MRPVSFSYVFSILYHDTKLNSSLILATMQNNTLAQSNDTPSIVQHCTVYAIYCHDLCSQPSGWQDGQVSAGRGF